MKEGEMKKKKGEKKDEIKLQKLKYIILKKF